LEINANLRLKRRLERELLFFDQRLRVFCDSLTESQDYSFCGYNFVSDLKEPLSKVNDYIFGFSCIYNVECFGTPELLKFRSKKWSRLKATKMSNPELDVVWRLWHDALLTFKVAKIMGLFTDGACPYCHVLEPKCRHIVFCQSTNGFWEYFWRLCGEMGIVVLKQERMVGYDDSPLLNTLLFCAIYVLYKRFIYNVNSGKTDYDLVQNFRQLLHAKIFFEYSWTKSLGSPWFEKFQIFWNYGKSLFTVSQGNVQIFL
jgi:hypothetical protein